MPPQAGELTLEMKRVLPATPSVVFAAFSAPGELARWWGPEGFTAPSLEFSPRVGHSYRIEMQPLEGDPFYIAGGFREVDAPARLAYTFVYEDPDPDDVENLVELSFRDLGQSTEVVLTQGPFKTEGRRELHRDGWADSLDKRASHLAGIRSFGAGTTTSPASSRSLPITAGKLPQLVRRERLQRRREDPLGCFKIADGARP